jgi:hypothetical protein
MSSPIFKGKLGTRLVDVPRANGCAAPGGGVRGVSVRFNGRRDDLVHRAATMFHRADDFASREQIAVSTLSTIGYLDQDVGRA